jgi:hypothetical protein
MENVESEDSGMWSVADAPGNTSSLFAFAAHCAYGGFQALTARS